MNAIVSPQHRALDIIADAAHRIGSHRAWGKGGSLTASRTCLWDAVYQAEHDDKPDYRPCAWTALKIAIGTTSIIGWNDRPETEHSDVQYALIRARIVLEHGSIT